MPNENKDDLFDDILLETGGSTEDKDIDFDPKELKAMKETIGKLEKEKSGLLKGVQEERRKRQEINGRLDQVTTTVNSILERREAALESQESKDSDTLKGIQVEFTEDGDAFVPLEKLSPLTEKYEEKIEALEEELNNTRNAQTSTQQYNQEVEAMVGKKPEYQGAYQQYRYARKWVSDQLQDFIMDNGYDRPLTSGEALSFAIDENFRTEFASQFPDLDLVSIVTAEDSPWHFEQMLEVTSTALNDLKSAPSDSRFQRVMNKPSTPGKSANAKGGELSLVDRASNLSAADLLNMDSKQAEALERALRFEEENDGIEW
jgi:uncharacterized coiled-coil DUF342 family protein